MSWPGRGRKWRGRARPVEIHSIEILSVSLPEITFRVACSKGTYIRTLCHDIGQKLGCGGTMKSPKRTRVGIFTIDGALKLPVLKNWRRRPAGRKCDTCGSDVYRASCPYGEGRFARLIENGNAFYPGQAEGKRKDSGRRTGESV